MPKKINSALLFTTTVRLFAEHGYGACTTQAIAAAAGVGGAVITLLTEAPRHPELGAALATLMPNMMQGAAIIASHQAAGRMGAGDPLQKLVILIAPIMATGLFHRIANAPKPVTLAPEMLAEMFLQGHG